MLSACQGEEERRAAPEPEAAAAAAAATPADARVPAPACEARRFEGSSFTACRYEAGRGRLRLFLDGADGRPLRSFSALEAHLGREAAALRFAMNAGMFDEEGRPIGLYVEEGRERRALNRRDGPGNFHMKPNGVFAVEADGTVSVETADAYARRGKAPRWASQSGPMLLVGGRLHPRFDADGPSRLVRNGVGVSDGRTAWFVISEEGVSFGRFARFLRDALGCTDALYFDGTVSSLWDPGAGRQDGYSSLGPIVAAFGPAEASAPEGGRSP